MLMGVYFPNQLCIENKELNSFKQDPVSIADNVVKETPKQRLPMKDMLDPVVNLYLDEKEKNYKLIN